jgi:polysaccharide chain length determinant protein (PEP-CTERM system associated)
VLPGKKYTPEDVVRILWRGKWLIALPFMICALAAAGIAYSLPNQYRSQTLVLVVPQRVPEAYVRSTVTTRIEERVRSIREQILSRSRLERIIEEFNLYAEERRNEPMEDVIERMRNNVFTRVVREDAFEVQFVADSPEVAQKVTARLAGLFGEENMRDRELQAENTNQFLRTQLEEAEKQLLERERQVTEYRRRYAGELPDQVQGNLQTIQNVEMQIQSLTDSLNRDRDRLDQLQRQLLETQHSEIPVLPPVAVVPNAAPSVGQQVETAEATLRQLEARLTPQHPDVMRAKAAVERLRKQIDSAPDGSPVLATSAAEIARRNRIAQLQAEIDSVTRQITAKQADEERLRGRGASYRARVEAAPMREADIVALTRDYETLQRQYRSLVEKYEESKVAANLERRQIGEQFRILDPAQVPERPYTPNRVVITAAGAVAGLLLGAGLVGFREFRNRTLRTRADVAWCIGLPVLAAIPVTADATAAVSRWSRLRIRQARG